MKKNRKSKKYSSVVYLVIILAIVFLFGIINKVDVPDSNCNTASSSNIIDFPDYQSFPMSVHFLNVGHADAALIQCEGKNILIDSGWQDPNSHVILYCKSHKVEKFDLVIATHPHGDHIGEMSKIIETFPIDTFIIAEFQEGYQEKVHSAYERMIKTVRSHKNIKLKKVKAGENFKLGNLKIHIFSPNKKHNNVNNNSIVAKLIFGERSFLFTGDTENESEKTMLDNRANLKSDVLKVAHHGSATSSKKKFIESVLPEYSVISFGKTTYSTVPNKKTIKNLQQVNSKILRTDKLGDIVFFTDGKVLKFVSNYEVNKKVA